MFGSSKQFYPWPIKDFHYESMHNMIMKALNYQPKEREGVKLPLLIIFIGNFPGRNKRDHAYHFNATLLQ